MLPCFSFGAGAQKLGSKVFRWCGTWIVALRNRGRVQSDRRAAVTLQSLLHCARGGHFAAFLQFEIRPVRLHLIWGRVRVKYAVVKMSSVRCISPLKCRVRGAYKGDLATRMSSMTSSAIHTNKKSSTVMTSTIQIQRFRLGLA